MEELILASASPRRQEILSRLGLSFTVCPAVHEPAADPSLSPEDAVLAIARAKAEEVAARFPERLVLGADTSVLLGDRFLGKPHDRQEAQDMLLSLSGCEHRVLTAVFLAGKGAGKGFCDTAWVRFFPLEKEEIRWYLNTGEPFDKAGAYGIQGAGGRFVEGITGDFYTVMGLPMGKLYRFLLSVPRLTAGGLL